MSEPICRFYDRAARQYDDWLRHYERWMGLGERRCPLLRRAQGRVLEVGVGTGANLACYADGVELVGVDLSPGMLAVASERAAALGRGVEFRVGDAARLDFADDDFDTVVATLVLSAVRDDRAVVAEVARVLRPGGRLLVLDHVRSSIAVVRWLQGLVAPVLRRTARWHPDRDLIDHLEPAGFHIEGVRRSRLGMIAEVVARLR